VRTPIHHVVVIYQENHSFDNVLGKLCVIDARCDGTTTGLLSDGSTIALPPQSDIVPNIPHDVRAQQRDIDGGKMDGFDTLPSCSQNVGYQCFDQVDPSQIPTLAALARAFVISDRTFEDGAVPSWGSHLSLVSGTLDGFVGDEPPDIPGQHPFGPGDGCDSGLDNYWQPPGGGSPILVPSCVPKPDGTGPYRPSPVQWVPTIMDRLSAKGKSWRIYGPQPGDFSYQWSICPVFADCVYSAQDQQLVPTDQVLTDAQAGTLPRVSFVIPPMSNSQHNNASMLQGDNWIESVVSSIMNGPDWKSTAIFITYDDCGCFYDHVPPPPGLGIRVPMVIVSPYARAGYTDHQTASFASLLAFIEHNFRLHPLSSVDKNAYDYSGSFDYNQTPLPPIPLEQHPLPPAEREYLRQHPPPADST
jgi:phospholipase C